MPIGCYEEPFYKLNVNVVGIFDGIFNGQNLGLGIKNLTNSYQNNFDSSKNRDSNFVYGPSTPRVFYFSIKFKSI